jgi:tetratricopeptide (TPR) repeat protein
VRTGVPAEAAPEAEPSQAVSAVDGSPEATPPARPVSPAETKPAEAKVEHPVSRAPGILARARSVARSYGPRAGAEVLEAGVRELPPGAPERADLYGELGNFHFAAGNFTAALAAYDSALRVLPEEERATMVQRLGPTYDRYHPSGRSHLDQFR